MRPKPSDGAAGLHGPQPARRHGVQNNDRWRITRESKQLLRGGDGFQIQNLRPARNDDQISRACGLKGRGLRPGWRINHSQVDALGDGRINSMRKSRGMYIGYYGRRRLATVPPATCARLRIRVQYDDGLSGGTRLDRKS